MKQAFANAAAYFSKVRTMALLRPKPLQVWTSYCQRFVIIQLYSMIDSDCAHYGRKLVV
jgi:hypothetical protein